ncbi:acyltransferase [Alkalihalobacillus sp. CinArs1]|uniref:acyltransferase n=1 Tax=Alkalihalobacillus sp. CinArs1 TaxID=2995314 RepID=UPI0022DD5932|nr:acyltransferase [Alkalihalobacillus sp. CinArs1]
MKNNKSGYINEIHFLRAIACLFVLAVHVTGIYYSKHGNTFTEYTEFFNQIGRFGTPIFAVISGFLLFLQVKKKGFDAKRFYHSRMVKIGMPFLIWSVVYLALMKFVLQVDIFTDWKRFVVDFAMGNSFYHLYFMSVVFQFYLIFPLLQLIRTKLGWWIALVLAIFANYYFVYLYSPENVTVVSQLMEQRAMLTKWIFFFVFGGFLAYNWDSIQKFGKKLNWFGFVGFAALILLAVYEYKAKGSIGNNRWTNMINIPVMTVMVIGMYQVVKKVGWIEKFFAMLGNLSMGIYLVHPLVIFMYSRTLPESVWTTETAPFMFAVILATSIGFIKVLQLFPLNHYVITVPAKKKPVYKEREPKPEMTLSVR